MNARPTYDLVCGILETASYSRNGATTFVLKVLSLPGTTAMPLSRMATVSIHVNTVNSSEVLAKLALLRAHVRVRLQMDVQPAAGVPPGEDIYLECAELRGLLPPDTDSPLSA